MTADRYEKQSKWRPTVNQVFFVPVKSVVKGDFPNCVKVVVDHCKEAGGVVATFYPITTVKGLETKIWFNYARSQCRLQYMVTLNQKKLCSICEVVADQIAKMTGEVWQNLEKYAKDHGFKIV